MQTQSLTTTQEPSLQSWYVVSTALSARSLMLECAKTGARGTVEDPTAEEWEQAFYAPSNPYPWSGELRRIRQL